jgi:hypothetical protein
MSHDPFYLLIKNIVFLTFDPLTATGWLYCMSQYCVRMSKIIWAYTEIKPNRLKLLLRLSRIDFSLHRDKAESTLAYTKYKGSWIVLV